MTAGGGSLPVARCAGGFGYRPKKDSGIQAEGPCRGHVGLFFGGDLGCGLCRGGRTRSCRAEEGVPVLQALLTPPPRCRTGTRCSSPKVGPAPPALCPPARPALSPLSPAGLAVLRVAYGDVSQLGVFCTEPIPKGVRFGPFQGKVVNTSEIKTYDDNSLMWEVAEAPPGSPRSPGGSGRGCRRPLSPA